MVQFQGETTGISPQQLEFIASALEKKGFKDAKVTIKAVGEAGDNYIANVKRIIAEKNGITFRLIAKVAPTEEQLRLVMNSHAIFYNEYVMYSQVLPKFTEIEEAAEIPESERLRYAKFHGAIMEEPTEIILLEDLQVPGFVMLDRFKPLSNEAIRLILKNFAKLHSLSYALKTQEPETYDKFGKDLVNIFQIMNDNESFKLFFKSIEDDAKSVLPATKYRAVLNNIAGKAADIYRTLYETDSKSRYNVIQQGDAWTNNIMFKFEGNVPTECCMIDYQGARVNSPVADLHYMIFACTDYEGRAKHYYEWIDYYYSELSKHLSNFGLKSEYWYPRDQLDADLRRHGKSSLVTSLFLASVLTRESAEAARMKEAMRNITADTNFEEVIKASNISSSSETTTNLYKTKIGETIDSLLELGYL